MFNNAISTWNFKLNFNAFAMSGTVQTIKKNVSLHGEIFLKMEKYA